MFSKVSSRGVSYVQTINSSRASYNYTGTFRERPDPDEIYIPFACSVNMKLTCSVYNTGLNSSQPVYVSIYDIAGGNTYATHTKNANNTSLFDVNLTGTIPAGRRITARYSTSTNYNTQIVRSTPIIYTLNTTIYKAPNAIRVFPKEIKEIGVITQVNLLGKQPNSNIYKNGIMISKETTATTGSITLGNAVGFIKVNFNGEIIKIPYYSN